MACLVMSVVGSEAYRGRSLTTWMFGLLVVATAPESAAVELRAHPPGTDDRVEDLQPAEPFWEVTTSRSD